MAAVSICPISAVGWPTMAETTPSVVSSWTCWRTRGGPSGRSFQTVVSQRSRLGSEHAQENDIPGYMIPEVYQTFVRTGDAGLVLPIIDHNELDLIAMADLLPLLA